MEQRWTLVWSVVTDRARALTACNSLWGRRACHFLLDGEQVMAMFRRSRRSTSPLRHRQQEIARQEAELHEKLDKLERMVITGRPSAKKKSPTLGGEQGARSSNSDKRFPVSIAFETREDLDP